MARARGDTHKPEAILPSSTLWLSPMSGHFEPTEAAQLIREGATDFFIGKVTKASEAFGVTVKQTDLDLVANRVGMELKTSVGSFGDTKTSIIKLLKYQAAKNDGIIDSIQIRTLDDGMRDFLDGIPDNLPSEFSKIEDQIRKLISEIDVNVVAAKYAHP